MVNQELGNTSTCIKEYAGNDLDTSDSGLFQFRGGIRGRDFEVEVPPSKCSSISS